MDKIFNSEFDFFAHAIPGFFIIAAIVIATQDITSIEQLLSTANEVNVGGGILIFVISFVTGYAIHPFGRLLYKSLGKFIFREKIKNDVKAFISDKYALIREHSPNNFKYINAWNMFCAMAHNMAIACIVLGSLSAVKAGDAEPGQKTFWIYLAIASFIAFFIFLQRAVRFSIWAAHDINATISRLRLMEKE